MKAPYFYKKKTLNRMQRVLDVLSEADCVTIDNGPILHGVGLDIITCAPKNVVIEACWYDAEGNLELVKVTEAELSKVTVDHGIIKVRDTSGTLRSICAFELFKKSVNLNKSNDLDQLKRR